MAVGTLTWWSSDRGFGFIQNDAGGPDMFVHSSDLKAAGIDPTNIRLGQRLTFETSSFNGRPKADNVRIE